MIKALRHWLVIVPVVVAATSCAPNLATRMQSETAQRGVFPQSFATQLAGPSTFLAPMPTAIVVLKPDDLNRNRAFCGAFAQLPTSGQATAASVVAPNLVLTRWLVQLPQVPAERTTDCDFLVGTYDYARAGRLIATTRLASGSLAGRGPFLLMIVPDQTGMNVVGIDGSGYDDSGFASFVQSWGTALNESENRITTAPNQPGLVRSLVDLVSAVFRTAAGGAGGLIKGIIQGL